MLFVDERECLVGREGIICELEDSDAFEFEIELELLFCGVLPYFFKITRGNSLREGHMQMDAGVFVWIERDAFLFESCEEVIVDLLEGDRWFHVQKEDVFAEIPQTADGKLRFSMRACHFSAYFLKCCEMFFWDIVLQRDVRGDATHIEHVVVLYEVIDNALYTCSRRRREGVYEEVLYLLHHRLFNISLGDCWCRLLHRFRREHHIKAEAVEP